jgi:hypothetical protein
VIGSASWTTDHWKESTLEHPTDDAGESPLLARLHAGMANVIDPLKAVDPAPTFKVIAVVRRLEQEDGHSA